MVALFVILGLTFALSSLVGEDDSDDEVEEPERRELTEGDDIVSDGANRDKILATLSDLVAESEITQAEADAGLAEIVFTTGPQDIATLGGDDIVLGGSDDDRIDSGAGDDTVIGGVGDDLVRLGEGEDVAAYNGINVTGDDEIRTASALLTVPLSEAVDGDDTILGGEGDDLIVDGFGANLLNGQQNDDVISAIDARGGTFSDIFSLEMTPDTVLGGFGDDTLSVDQGDTVSTGRGSDEVIVDLFVDVAAGYDLVTITDFVPAEDILVLDGPVDLLGLREIRDDVVIPNRITVEDSEDGTSAIVSVSGVPVVLVIGGQGMTVADIRTTV